MSGGGLASRPQSGEPNFCDPNSHELIVNVLDGYTRYLDEGEVVVTTLSDRMTDAYGTAISTIYNRYADSSRLDSLPDWRTFPSASTAQRYGGSILLSRLDRQDLRAEHAILLRPSWDKPQHAILRWPDIWILGVSTLRRYHIFLTDVGPNLELQAECDDPWLSGGHTLDMHEDGRLVVSVSAADAVLVLNSQNLNVESRWRIPEEVAGRNWDFSLLDDLRNHYIPNDYQLAHLNGAAWHRGGFLYSALSGVIGFARQDGSHQVVSRGLASCHGVRSDVDEGVYFVDSAAGMIIGLGSDNQIRWRQSVNSRWLHDAVHIGGGVYLCSLSDARALWFIERSEAEPRRVIELHGFEGSPQFLSLAPSSGADFGAATQIGIRKASRAESGDQ
jgi:hypothetical protein